MEVDVPDEPQNGKMAYLSNAFTAGHKTMLTNIEFVLNLNLLLE